MTDERIINYLLKELPEEELEQFEDECFAQERWPSHLNLVEGDLIDDYLRGELSPERRRRFERNYLTTEARRKRVAMAAALLRRVDELTPQPAPAAVVAPPAPHTWADLSRAFWRSLSWKPQAAVGAVALASVFFIAGAWWLGIPRRQADPAHSAAKVFQPLVLHISHGNRAEGVREGKAKLSRAGAGLKLLLTLPQPFAHAARYRIQLENEDGEIKLSQEAAREDQIVSLEIPAGLLARGRYAVKLFAAQDGTEQRIPGHYYFDVE
jgi:hypothetical protein